MGHGLNRDAGVQHGAAERTVRRATVSLIATPDVIQVAELV